ncbi:MAG TPA: TatD family hydrolase [Desulfobacteraceae bacterium]|nr:TatD family hydrolase [Desulfobacteraceae bacterium]HPQ29788.1 TatD family hydrolase [Desulfobacteraceae bacterium]
MLIDSHAHLDMKDFDKDREEVFKRAKDGGITHIVTIGIDLESSLDAVRLSKEYDFIYATVGCHPHNADTCTSEILDRLAQTASETKVRAWGEIGLDFFRNRSSRESQLKVFRKQLELSDSLGLPVVIHDREAHDDVLSILKKMGKGDKKGIIHCFSGDVDMAFELIDMGYYISIPGTVTFNKAHQVKKVASVIPLDRMLIETDCPFLAPVPKRGKRNEPLFVNYTAKEIADLRNVPFEEIARATSDNAKIIFNLE